MAADNSNIIESFLVGLGFDVDSSSLAIFNKAIETAALRVTALYGAVNAFAGSMVFAFSKISEGFEEMGYQYHIIAPAINKAIVLRQEMLKAYSAAGINIRKTIVDSINLNLSLSKTKFALEAIYKSVGSKFFGLLQKQSDMFRKRLYENMPYIIGALEHLVKAVFKAFEWVTILGGRIWSILTHVYEFFVDLDKATGGWSTKIMLVIAAWKLLNLEFLATPLGALIAGFLALLTIWDDYKTFREGGKSLFNWGPWIPVIDAVTVALTALKNVFVELIHLAKDFVFGEGWKTLGNDISALVDDFLALDKAIDSVIRKLGGDAINKALDWRDRIDQGAADWWKGPHFWNGGGQQPLGAGGGSNPPTNVNARMQTDIHITGSPNADATARATAGQQQGVNRDMVRNLKGATR